MLIPAKSSPCPAPAALLRPVLQPRSSIPSCGALLHEASTRVQAIRPSALPLACSSRMEREPLGFPLELRTPPLPAAHVEGGARPSSTNLEQRSMTSATPPILRVHSMRATSRRTTTRSSPALDYRNLEMRKYDRRCPGALGPEHPEPRRGNRRGLPLADRGALSCPIDRDPCPFDRDPGTDVRFAGVSGQPALSGASLFGAAVSAASNGLPRLPQVARCQSAIACALIRACGGSRPSKAEASLCC